MCGEPAKIGIAGRKAVMLLKAPPLMGDDCDARRSVLCSPCCNINRCFLDLFDDSVLKI